MAEVKEQFADYNLRTIYKKMNEKRSLLLCIDALDMVTEHGECPTWTFQRKLDREQIRVLSSFRPHGSSF